MGRRGRRLLSSLLLLSYLPQKGILKLESVSGGRGPLSGGTRKVRAPQGRALGNTQAERSDGKWHRNYTARTGVAGLGKGEKVG